MFRRAALRRGRWRVNADSARISETAVERLLRAAEREAEQLRSSSSTCTLGTGAVAVDSAARALPPDLVPGLRLEGEPRLGGQGFVYRATHLATRKCVAVKFLRGGVLDQPSHWRRLEREAEILAELNHPQIVGIRDTGVADGLRYLVMDYVDGAPLDAFVAAQSDWAARDTLRLFAAVCDAVNAAHLRGVIHRDLKPGNILVDAQGVPHVLDFGLGKFLADEARPDTLTSDGQFIGSVPWASPEQAAGRNADVDMRTDVYSLGVLLYHLLTKVFPYDSSGGWRAVLARIQNDDPRPLSPSEQTRSAGAARWRRDDEVETIVLKCLAKERERRYQSAGELGRDLRRYLAGEPIAAKRDSLSYVLWKLVRRHRWRVLAGVAVLAVALAGGLTSLALWRQAAAERDRAETNARTTAAVEQELTGLLMSLRILRLDAAQAAAVGQLLDERSAALEPTLRSEPAMAIRVRTAFRHLYLALDRPTSAVAQATAVLEAAREAYGPCHRQVAAALELCSSSRRWAGDLQGAEAYLREAVSVMHAVGGPRDPYYIALVSYEANVAEALGDLARAEAIARQMLELQLRAGIDTRETRRGLAEWLRRQGSQRYAEAEQWQREALAAMRQVEDEVPLAHHLHSYGVLLCDMGRSSEAEDLLREAVEIRRRAADDEEFHPYLRRFSEIWLGIALLQQGCFAEAEPLLASYAAIESLVWERRYLRPSKTEALAAIVRAYETWDTAAPRQGFAEQAAAWRVKLDELTANP